MVGSLVKGDADLIAASLTLTPKRFEALNYLIPIGTETFGLFIPEAAHAEILDFTGFFGPFSTPLWIWLMLNALVLAIIIQFAWKCQVDSECCEFRSRNKARSQIVKFISHFWLIVASYTGKANTHSNNMQATWKRVLFFTIFFVGNGTFMTYRAALTSELSIRRHKLPLDSLEDLIPLNYKYDRQSQLTGFNLLGTYCI